MEREEVERIVAEKIIDKLAYVRDDYLPSASEIKGA